MINCSSLSKYFLQYFQLWLNQSPDTAWNLKAEKRDTKCHNILANVLERWLAKDALSYEHWIGNAVEDEMLLLPLVILARDVHKYSFYFMVIPFVLAQQNLLLI